MPKSKGLVPRQSREQQWPRIPRESLPRQHPSLREPLSLHLREPRQSEQCELSKVLVRFSKREIAGGGWGTLVTRHPSAEAQSSRLQGPQPRPRVWRFRGADAKRSYLVILLQRLNILGSKLRHLGLESGDSAT